METDALELPQRQRRFVRKHGLALLTLVLLALGQFVVWPLTAWQRREQKEAVSVNNLRQLGQGLLLYAQDWDDRPMPPVLHLADGSWRTWPTTILPYIVTTKPLDNPLNPLRKGMKHPIDGYAITAGYALNCRFVNTFGEGVYSLDDLELPYRTVLFVEAGPMWKDPLSLASSASPQNQTGVMDYGDVSDTFNGLTAYPSPHNRKMALVAADGHAELVTVAHYHSENGPHDKRYGRIGGAIYNWNGGFPNGQTDRPPRE